MDQVSGIIIVVTTPLTNLDNYVYKNSRAIIVDNYAFSLYDECAKDFTERTCELNYRILDLNEKPGKELEIVNIEIDDVTKLKQ